MLRSYEKSSDEKSAKILTPQIAEKEQVQGRPVIWLTIY